MTGNKEVVFSFTIDLGFYELGMVDLSDFQRRYRPYAGALLLTSLSCRTKQCVSHTFI
jgi:hypothetical protein